MNPVPHIMHLNFLSRSVFLCVCLKRKRVCACPCIVAGQIQPSTWLTSDISVSSPLSVHHCAASYSPVTPVNITQPIHT